MRSGDWPVLHPSLGSMHNRAVFLACVVLLIGEGSCASPPLWKMPPGLASGSRVRVVSPSLGSAWQPGRTLLSTKGCWIIQAAVTYDPNAITVLTPRQVTRLQVSEAVPPPDWWVVPEDAEGWSELLPGVLEEASTPKCRGGDSSTGTM